MRYGEQQTLINAVAKSLGCVVFRPDYHGLDRDGNTVLLYFPEDAEHNLKVDKEPTHYSSKDEARHYGCTDERYFYRPYFWSFENTDANGMLTLDFANREYTERDRERSIRWLIAAILLSAVLLCMLLSSDTITNFAVFSMGLRGAVVLIPLCCALWRKGKIDSRFAMMAVIAGPTIVIIFVLLNCLPFDPLFLGIASAALIMLIGRVFHFRASNLRSK